MRTTSTAVTKMPKPKVTYKMIFCFCGRLMPLRTGIGSRRIKRSVMILTGAEDKYKVVISVQREYGGFGSLNKDDTGRHWNMLTRL